MALGILSGSSVSVKNEKLYDTILREASAHPEYSYVLLVPEQASLYTQEEMVRRAKNHALMNIDILTFNRLAYRVFQALHEPERKILDDQGKLMLLRLVAREQEENLSVLRKNIRKAGYLEELKSLFSEFAQYNISPEKLRESTETLKEHPGLQKKLRELSALYGAFLQKLHQNYEIAEERLSRLARLIPDWTEAGRTVFALTGFTGFTPPQEEVLQALLPRAKDIFLSVDLGSEARLQEQREEEALFHMSYTAVSRVTEMALRAGIPVETVDVSENLPVSGTILEIEQGLCGFPGKVFPDGGEDLHIFRAASPEEEVRILMRELRKRLNGGCRLRDMAVIAGDPARYKEEIGTRMRAQGLPVFFDETRALDHNPLFLLLKELLSVFSEGWSYEAVTAFLKTPLYVRAIEWALSDASDPLSVYERICELENFCLARGIRGMSRFEKPFSGRYRRFAEGRLESLNALRKAAFEPLFALHEALLRRNGSVSERLGAVAEFLEEIGAEESMAALSQETEDAALSREYEKSYELLTGFFAKTEEILGEERLSFEAFSEVLLSGLSGLHLGLVPPGKDVLLVGDLRRTRLNRPRVLFILGANDGLLPMLPKNKSILSDADREILSGAAVHLSPTEREESFSAQFYLYRLMTEAKEEVVMSYALSDADARRLNPAPLIARLLRMFPALRIETAGTDPLVSVMTPEEGLDYTAGIFREAVSSGKLPSLEDMTLSRWLLSFPRTEKSFLSVLQAAAFRYVPESISAETAARLFGASVQESVSRLERFSACPFSHFLNYGLALSERQEYRLEAADMGTVLHDSINSFFMMMGQEGLEFSSLSEKKQEELSSRAVDQVTGAYEEGLMQDSARNRYLKERVLRLIRRTVSVLKSQWDAGGYTATRTEVPFGEGRGIDAVRLPLPEGLALSLQGRIDRMDISEKDGKIYVKIIDYKSGKKDVDYTKIYYGLQLQLLLYMEAARDGLRLRHPGSEIVPAGIYYYHIDDPMVDEEDAQEDVDAAIEKMLQLRGVTNREPEALQLLETDFDGNSRVVSGLRQKKDGSFYEYSKVADRAELEALGGFARKKAAEIAERMQKGECAVLPYQVGQEGSCDFCPYKTVCGFDPKIAGYRMQRLRKKELSDLMPEEGEGA